MSNRIGLPLSSTALPTMWNDVAASIACSTLAFRSATEVLDPPPGVLGPLLGVLDPLDGEPLVLVLHAAISAAQARAAATLRCLRRLSPRRPARRIMLANSNRCLFPGFCSRTGARSDGPGRRRPGRSCR